MMSKKMERKRKQMYLGLRERKEREKRPEGSSSMFRERAISSPESKDDVVRGKAVVGDLGEHSPKSENPTSSLDMRGILWEEKNQRSGMVRLTLD
jgi:hypothetical protein